MHLCISSMSKKGKEKNFLSNLPFDSVKPRPLRLTAGLVSNKLDLNVSNEELQRKIMSI